MDDLEKSYRQIASRVSAAAEKSGRGARAVTLIAVSKKQSADKVFRLYQLGHRDFGENYVQELVSKAEDLKSRGCTDIRWHLIGHLQSNKARAVIPWVHSVHTVDSEKIASALAREWEKTGRVGKLQAFIEVNISREDTKSGVLSEGVSALASQVSGVKSLELQGLMCVPSAEEKDAALAARFEELRSLEASLGSMSRRQLSMGMSSDFETAIAHGATHVRVGTALFGARA